MNIAECKKCVHYEVCNPYVATNINFPNVEKCDHFKDKYLMVELPCKVDKIGEYVYYIPTYADCIEDVIECKIEKIVIYADRIRVYMRNEYNFCDFSPLEFSQRVAFDKEDAEAKLKEIEKK